MKKLIFILTVLILFSCESKPNEQAIRKEVETTINAGLEATFKKDIDQYMALIPHDMIIRDESGELVTREKQREYVIRDWGIIDTTLAISIVVDSLFLEGDSAVVYTSQRWTRMMFRRDHVTKDTVLTTQQHRELWKEYPNGWLSYDIEELGGEIFINGEKYRD